MAVRIAVVLALVALAGACQLPGTGCTVQIDWVDFVQIGATQYVAGAGSAPTLRQDDLGPVVAHVKFKVSGNVCDPDYRPKDGDAAFLDVGTPIYAVKGQAAGEVVAASHDGRVVRYDARSP